MPRTEPLSDAETNHRYLELQCQAYKLQCPTFAPTDEDLKRLTQEAIKVAEKFKEDELLRQQEEMLNKNS